MIQKIVAEATVQHKKKKILMNSDGHATKGLLTRVKYPCFSAFIFLVNILHQF